VPGGMTSARARGTVRACSARVLTRRLRTRARPPARMRPCVCSRARAPLSFLLSPPFASVASPFSRRGLAPRARATCSHSRANLYIARACKGESWFSHTLRERDTTASQASLACSPQDIKCKAALSIRPVCQTTEHPLTRRKSRRHMRFDWAPTGSAPHSGLYLHMLKARFALFQLSVS
jgi:hypothetical protein